jgi:hypothetical protein
MRANRAHLLRRLNPAASGVVSLQGSGMLTETSGA